jgi:hypothetical protein
VYLTFALDGVGGQLHALAALHPAKRIIPALTGNRTPAVHLVAQSLY